MIFFSCKIDLHNQYCREEKGSLMQKWDEKWYSSVELDSSTKILKWRRFLE